MIKQAIQSSFYIFLSIILGILFGIHFEIAKGLSDYIDYMVLSLVFMVLLDAPLDKFIYALKQPKFLFIAWVSNFIIIPAIGFTLTKLFLPNNPMVAIGLAIYFMFPCTDWFLGFVRMANGNTLLGGVLLPINMLTQFILYPVYLSLFGQSIIIDTSIFDIFSTLFNWFFVPFLLAVLIKFTLYKKYQVIKDNASNITSFIIYAIVFSIFSVHVNQIIENYNILASILITTAAFFVVSTFITEAIAKIFHFNYENHVLYAITITARNAPLMLGLTMTALPNQPMIYTSIIIGMLIEFPYLALQVARFKMRSNSKTIQPSF